MTHPDLLRFFTAAAAACSSLKCSALLIAIAACIAEVKANMVTCVAIKLEHASLSEQQHTVEGAETSSVVFTRHTCL